MIETGQPVRAYGDFHHITKSRTWAQPRRLIANVEHKPGHQQRCRFLVTSLDRHQPGLLSAPRRRGSPVEEGTIQRVVG